MLNIGSSTGVVWVTGGRLVVTNALMAIGNGASGQMTISNGTYLALAVNVGDSLGSVGTLTVAGGTNVLSNVFVVGNGTGSKGAVWVTGGLLVATNNLIEIGNFGVGQMTISNGTVPALSVIVGRTAGSQGTLTVAGGTNTISSTLTVGSSAKATGTVWVTGGQLVVTNNNTVIGNAGVGQMTVSNVTVLSGAVTVGNVGGSKGTLTVAGGTNTISSSFTTGLSANATGAVWVTGGQLVVTNNSTTIGFSGVGQMTVSNEIGRAHV